MDTDRIAAFVAKARAAGFDEVIERQWAPETVVATHTHAFDALWGSRGDLLGCKAPSGLTTLNRRWTLGSTNTGGQRCHQIFSAYSPCC